MAVSVRLVFYHFARDFLLEVAIEYPVKNLSIFGCREKPIISDSSTKGCFLELEATVAVLPVGIEMLKVITTSCAFILTREFINPSIKRVPDDNRRRRFDFWLVFNLYFIIGCVADNPHMDGAYQV